MKHDPFTLRVALDTAGNAHGELHLDDGEMYANECGSIVWRGLIADKGCLLNQEIAKCMVD